MSLALRRGEALFLRDQLAARCPGTLLQWLATAGAAPIGDFWDELAVMTAPKEVQETVEHARRFSRHVEGAPLLYNLMLAQQRRPSPVDDDLEPRPGLERKRSVASHCRFIHGSPAAAYDQVSSSGENFAQSPRIR